MLVKILIKQEKAPDLIFDWSLFTQSTNNKYTEALVDLSEDNKEQDIGSEEDESHVDQ